MGRVFSGNPDFCLFGAFDIKAILILNPECLIYWISKSILLLSSHTNMIGVLND